MAETMRLNRYLAFVTIFVSRKATVGKSKFISGLLVLSVFGSCMLMTVPLFSQDTGKLYYVNNFVGTTESNVPTKWGSAGGLYPGAVAPFGYVQISPQTSVLNNSGYNYKDSSIYFFSCIQHKSGYPGGSAGHVFVMPVVNPDDFQLNKSARPFRHSDETASPGYYGVRLADNKTFIETTASVRSGIIRFTFPAFVIPRIFIGDAGKIVLQTSNRIKGSLPNVVFQFDTDFTETRDKDEGVIFSFPASASGKTVIVLKMATSTIDAESALKNMNAEFGSKSFDEIRQSAEKMWSNMLSVVDIRDKDITNKKIFYTALYHSLLLPWVISDVDGLYKGRDGVIHQSKGKDEYGQFSPWDTFRSLHPLLCLLFPDRQSDMVASMLDLFSQQGYLPTGTMTGNHMIPIIVDSYFKKIKDIDTVLAYTAMKKSVVDTPGIQKDMPVYRTMGYVPSTFPESVTRTMEYAYDDWALARYSKTAMKNDPESEKLFSGSYNYRHLFYPPALFFLPRNQDKFSLNPGNSGYKEGDQWVYSYFVPQHVRDLINMMGGNEVFAGRLDTALANGKILFDNETIFHIPYLFNWACRPHKTQDWVRKILGTRFSLTPGGIPGNDDMGSMSSWFVFSSMGIYPTCPGKPEYSIGYPLFDEVVIHLPNGKKFTIHKQHGEHQNNYIRSLAVDEQSYHDLTVSHATIVKGGTMLFDMASYPNDKWFRPSNSDDSIRDSYFKILYYTVSNKRPEPNEKIKIYFSVKNMGSQGTKVVPLYVNEKLYGSNNCFVKQGETVSDSMECRLYPVGKTKITLGNLKETEVEVVKPLHRSAVATGEVTGLSVPSILAAGEPVPVSFYIQNIDGYRKEINIPVVVNQQPYKTISVSLEPGGKKNINIRLKIPHQGFQKIRVYDKEILCKIYDRPSDAMLLNLYLNQGNRKGSFTDSSGFLNTANIIRSKEMTIGENDSLLFDKDTYVEISKSENLELTGQMVTMMTWVFPEKIVNGYQDILTKGDKQVIQVSKGKKIVFFAGGWGIGDCTADLPADWINHWHHLAGVCDGKTLKLYIDGNLRATSALSGNVDFSSSNKWCLGRNEEFPGQRIFSGYLDKVRIFSVPLSGEEVKMMMNK
jgi:putative alpha-1,2-mannosidase